MAICFVLYDYSEDGPETMLVCKDRTSCIAEACAETSISGWYETNCKSLTRLQELLESKTDEELFNGKDWPLTDGWGGLRLRVTHLE